MKASDTPDADVLRLLAKNPTARHASWPYVEHSVLPAFPPNAPHKVVQAKMRKLIKRGLVEGCSCGCRGDYVITPKGPSELRGAACSNEVAR